MKKYKIIIAGQILLMTKTEIENLDTSHMTKLPDLSLAYFSGAELSYFDLSKWNISSISKMTELFKNADAFNQDVESWGNHARAK